jgi:hypothetical protein
VSATSNMTYRDGRPITVGDLVVCLPRRYAPKIGRVMQLNLCRSERENGGGPCLDPRRHDEVRVEGVAEVTTWFRADELSPAAQAPCAVKPAHTVGKAPRSRAMLHMDVA